MKTYSPEESAPAVTDCETADTYASHLIKNYYAPFLMHRTTKLVVVVAYVVYLAVSIYGCTKLKNGLQPTRLMMDDSPVVNYYKLQEAYFWDAGVQAQVAFTSAGDLSSRATREKVVRVLAEFANSAHGLGNDAIDFWMTAFDEYLGSSGLSLATLRDAEFFDSLNFFLSFDENAAYRNDIHWENSTTRSNITAFR